MSENVIFCYSGTGNCLDMAKTIARELGINKSTVSRTLSNSTMKLYRSLRYSL